MLNFPQMYVVAGLVPATQESADISGKSPRIVIMDVRDNRPAVTGVRSVASSWTIRQGRRNRIQ